jgi:hypothetical protein
VMGQRVPLQDSPLLLVLLVLRVSTACEVRESRDLLREGVDLLRESRDPPRFVHPRA